MSNQEINMIEPQLAIFNNLNQTTGATLINYTQLKEMIKNPAQAPDGSQENKNLNTCLMASTCTVGKTKDLAKQHNDQTFFRVDSDDGEFTFETLAQALRDLNITRFVMWASWNHTEANQRIKVLIPVLHKMEFDVWVNIQARLTEALGTDDCVNSSVQISFSPATYPGHEYRYHIETSQNMSDFNSLPQLKPLPVIAKRAPVAHNGDSIIDEFNSRFQWDYELQCAGYTKKGSKWRSPEATSLMAGGKILVGDDGKHRFFTHHSSDPVFLHGAVDGFEFSCIRSGMSHSEMVKALGEGELKDFNKKLQRDYMEKKEAEEKANNAMSGADLERFAKAMATPAPVIKKTPPPVDFSVFFTIVTDGNYSENDEVKTVQNNWFGNIVTNGNYSENDDLTPHELQVKKVISKNSLGKVELKTDGSKPEWAFDIPVDESIDLLTAPGLVGECIDYINSQAIRPRPVLAVSTALSAIGMVASLSHEDASYPETSSNLFCFNVAGSGSGKNAVLKAGSQIIKESGFRGSVYGKIKSEQEIYRNLINSQCAYYSIDEIGEVLGKITASTETYMTGIIGTLMTVFSQSTSQLVLGGDEQAEIKERMNKKEAFLNKKINDVEDPNGFYKLELDSLVPFMESMNQSGGIDMPFLSISGYTTPVRFIKIATRENVLTGFIPRTLIFNEEIDAPRKIYDYVKSGFPANLSHELKKIRNIGNQSLSEHGRVQNYGERVKVTTTDEAKAWLKAMDYHTDTRAIEHSRTDGFQALVNRYVELVLKVSFILAIGDGKVRTLAHVKWAHKLVEMDMITKINLVKGNLDDEEVTAQEKAQEIIERVTDFLTKKMQPFLPSVIAASMRNFTKKDVEMALLALIKVGKVSAVLEAGKKDKFQINLK